MNKQEKLRQKLVEQTTRLEAEIVPHFQALLQSSDPEIWADYLHEKTKMLKLLNLATKFEQLGMWKRMKEIRELLSSCTQRFIAVEKTEKAKGDDYWLFESPLNQKGKAAMVNFLSQNIVFDVTEFGKLFFKDEEEKRISFFCSDKGLFSQETTTHFEWNEHAIEPRHWQRRLRIIRQRQNEQVD